MATREPSPPRRTSSSAAIAGCHYRVLVTTRVLASRANGRAPLGQNEMRYFEEIVSARAAEIVTKWIDFFVLHKPIKPERITTRLK